MRAYACVVSAFLLSGCSVVPSLSEATGKRDSPVLIADVVTRVKCEISDSFDELRPYDSFLWVRDWTAKVDLTLQANVQAGISPSGSYTTFQKNAFNYDAGSTSLTSNTIGAVAQSFTLSAGANAGEQALRTEVVSFSVGIDELHEWRKQVAKLESDPNFPPEKKVCYHGNAQELEGDLGLREWVKSAFFPVYRHELLAGNHPAPNAAKTPGPAAAVGPPKPIPGPAAGERPVTQPKPEEQWTKDITASHSNIKDALQQAGFSLNDAITARDQIDKALTAARKAEEVNAPIGTPPVQQLTSSIVKNLTTALGTAKGDVKKARDLVANIQELSDAADLQYQDFVDNQNDGKPTTFLRDRDNVVAEDISTKASAASVKRLAEHAQNIAKAVASASFTPDPPIDSILHSVQFVVSYGASITPSWTLISWKGPGLNAPAASAQGARTHLLQIALGPRNPSSKSTQEQQRLINNAILLSVRP